MDAKIYSKFCEHGRGIELELWRKVTKQRAPTSKKNKALLEVYQIINQLFDQVITFSLEFYD